MYHKAAAKYFVMWQSVNILASMKMMGFWYHSHFALYMVDLWNLPAYIIPVKLPWIFLGTPLKVNEAFQIYYKAFTRDVMQQSKLSSRHCFCVGLFHTYSEVIGMLTKLLAWKKMPKSFCHWGNLNWILIQEWHICNTKWLMKVLINKMQIVFLRKPLL